MSKLSFGTNKHGSAITSEQQEPSGSSGKRRVSRWDSQPKIDGRGGESDSLNKRRKTRWSDDSQLKMSGPSHIPAVQVCQDIIAKLIEKNTTFKSPSENKLPELSKRLYIPTRQYPSYNFTGLIIGPRGNTIKRMEKETGARIVLRGKGSRKDGKKQQKPDPLDEEDLHVLIKAENQKSLDDAVGMVEKLLIPVDEGMNDHKRAQLRELADLNGTLRDENFCNCGQVRHMKYACPSLDLVSPCGTSCSTCGGNTHSTVNCPLTVSTPSGDLANQQKRSFLADIGGAGGFTFSTPQTSCSNPWQSGNTGFGISPVYISNSDFGAGSSPTAELMSSEDDDHIKLVVRHLPQIVDDVRLRELFAPFGRLIEAKVMMGSVTGLSKEKGYVKYDNPSNAMAAVVRMNGYKIGGRTLTVTVADNSSTAVVSSSSLQPWKHAPAVASQDSVSPASWPGPPGSMLSDSQFSSPKSHHFGLPQSSVFLGQRDNSSEQYPSSHPSLLQFPGNPDYRKSQLESYFSPRSSFSPQTHARPSLGSSISSSPWAPIQGPRSSTAFDFP